MKKLAPVHSRTLQMGLYLYSGEVLYSMLFLKQDNLSKTDEI